MSAFIYAGPMQFVAVTMLSGGTNIFAAALTTLAVKCPAPVLRALYD